MSGTNSVPGGSPNGNKDQGAKEHHSNFTSHNATSRRPSILGTSGGSKSNKNQKRGNVPVATGVSTSGGSSGNSGHAVPVSLASLSTNLNEAGSGNSSPTSSNGSASGHNSANNSISNGSNQGRFSQLSRSRSKSLSQHIASHHPSQNQYLAQEKGYLKKIKNEANDDYYTKAIKEEDDEKDTDLNQDDDDVENVDGAGGLLADIDDDKYEIDFRSAFSLMRYYNKDLKLTLDENESANDVVDDPKIIERMEWQSMLVSVLTGDVVKSEKTKLINSSNPENEQELYVHAAYKNDLWLGIKAKLLNRTEDEHRKIIMYRRTAVDLVLDEIMKYEIKYESESSPRAQVIDILDRYEKACSLWKTLEDMRHEKPICATQVFQMRVDALNAWLSITDAINTATKSMSIWIGNDELDISKSPVQPSMSPTSSQSLSSSKMIKNIFNEDKSLAERLMKEKEVDSIFEKRIFIPLARWMTKAKTTFLELGPVFESLKLPDYLNDLIEVCIIPLKLIKEIIEVRLGYALKLKNPTLSMIDQMIGDFRSYLSIALGVRLGIEEYCKPDPANRWILSDLFESEYQDFDEVILRSVKFFLTLVNKKLLGSARNPKTFRTFKESEELEDTWNYLKWLGGHVENSSTVVAQEILLIASKLHHRLLVYFNNQVSTIATQATNVSDLVRWYSSTTGNFGQMRRKLNRFIGEVSRDFTNSLVFELPYGPTSRLRNLLEVLKSSNHFLVYTGTAEKKGTYFFASPNLYGRNQEILKIINGSYLGVGGHISYSIFVNMFRTESVGDDDTEGEATPSSEYNDSPYVLVVCPPKPIVWEGTVVTLNIDDIPITEVQMGQILLITKEPYYRIATVGDKFLSIVGDAISVSGIIRPVEQICSLAKVYSELKKINRISFKITLAVLDSVAQVRENCHKVAPEGGYQELVNNYFLLARGYGRVAVKQLDSTRKSLVIMKLIQLSIDWVSFIADECVPTDRKTFKWCVVALEFAMDMTRGFNVLTLGDEMFYTLKVKVSRCMSLLISHFDIMGARSSEAEKRKLLKWRSLKKDIENTADDDYIMKAYRDEVMKSLEEVESYRKEVSTQIGAVGRVLDATDSEYQFVTLLASSFSSVSIRWQKGRFIGGGTSGSVYAAVNLDTGGIMAVKDIRFHDSQSIKNIVPAIKDEMTVLEILNHPNIVQYFGVEVHRDKVYIFMEYCEGGSLASLLSHGRIEDEMVIQVYALQMLEGVAYLHQSGVIHRDIKPENILLDHNGIIKFVDFGAAKVIATGGRTRMGSKSRAAAPGGDHNKLSSMIGTPMYMSPEVITGTATEKDSAVDIWSLGCCILEMATGRRPWANLDNEWAIMYHIAAGHKPQLPSHEQLSEGGIKFLSKCLEHDPNRRPSAVELLSDPWILAIHQSAFGSSDGLSTPSSEISVDLSKEP